MLFGRLAVWSVACQMTKRAKPPSAAESLMEKLERGKSWKDTTFGTSYSKTYLQKLERILLHGSDFDLSLNLSLDGHSSWVNFRSIVMLYLLLIASSYGSPIEDEIMLKLWWDERKIHRGLQMCGGISMIYPQWPTSHNSWRYFLPCFYQDNTASDDIPSMFNQTGIEEMLEECKEVSYEIATHNLSLNLKFVIVVDWKCYYELDTDCVEARDCQLQRRLCPCCGFLTNHKISTWMLDPYKLWTRDLSLSTYYSKLVNSITFVLYDPLHGLARLVSNMLSGFRSFLKKLGLTRLANMLSVHIPNFKKDDVNINSERTKQFLDNDTVVEGVSNIFENYKGQPLINLALPDESHVNISLSDLFVQMFAAMREFKKFIYSQTCTLQSLQDLMVPRNFLLCCLLKFKYQLNPAPHYMLNHFFEDVENMFPARPVNWLCEGEEGANHYHRKMSKATPNGAKLNHSKLNTLQIMLRHAILLHQLKVTHHIGLPK